MKPSPTYSPSPAWGPRTRRTVTLLALAFAIALGWFVRDVLPLLVLSALLAFLLHPPVTFIQRRVLRLPFMAEGLRRTIGVFVAFILTIVLFTLVVLLIVPPLLGQVQDFLRALPGLFGNVETQLESLLSQPLTFNNDPILLNGEELIPLERIAEAFGTDDLSEIFQLDSLNFEAAANAFFSSVRELSGPAFSFLGGAFNTVISFVFLVMGTFYLAKDGPLFLRHLVDLAPEDYRGDAERLLHELGRVWRAYLRGQLLLCVVMGLAVYTAATVLGVPNAAILGLLAGILEFVPTIGPLIALIPAALLGLVSQSATFPVLEGPLFALVIIVVWTGLQQLEAVVLVPRIMGDSLELHPFVVIVAVLGGAALAGALGVILAAPFVASGRVLARYVYGKLLGTAPFREPDDPDSAAPNIGVLLGTLRDRLARLRSQPPPARPAQDETPPV